MAATMADVARIAGVSKKTVSNFFNGYPYMRDETRQRIEAAIEQLNYKVNISARNLSSGRTGSIGLAVPELAHPYFAELSQAVVSAAQRRGLNVLVEVTDGKRTRELDVLNGTGGRSVDGIIFEPIALSPDDIRDATTAIPLILIGDRVHEGRFDFVAVANEAGAHDATAHLLSSGRRRIVALGMEDSEEPTAAAGRYRGYLRALEEAGVRCDPRLLVGPIPWNRTAGADAVARLIDEGVEFDAVFGLNDALALGAMSQLQRRGLGVPQDVAVVGFDNVDEGRFSSPALTTIESGREWIAQKAVELLAQRLASPEESMGTTLLMAGHRLVERDSV
ncbi:LacI family DNA-binding transcriptional regulator [Microbacterium soli]|uniref:LacI family DNA-binding transcriptional regulator n=1 Tax=Microbacterium soli TaxID=446075 RepID=A0ABP7N613_9MICO